MNIPKILWQPDDESINRSNLSKYSRWLSENHHISFDNYPALWKWSVDEPAAFWESLWHYFKIITYSPYSKVLSDDAMPKAKWFEGSTLNYAEHVFRNKTANRPAILSSDEHQTIEEISWQQLENQTAALQAWFRENGIVKSDTIAAYLPNIPEATIGLLASLSLGAIWSSCSPDFGTDSVCDRFKQIAPKVLIAVDGYTYNGKPYDRMDVVKQLKQALPSVEKVILIPNLNKNLDPSGIKTSILWSDVLKTENNGLDFVPVPFEHPIWVLYSSGTTGNPKAITHSHGGMLLEHLKYLSFHNDVQEGENFFWYSTTGWMMWNFLQASLLVGATAVIYDGSPGKPDLNALWKLAETAPIHHFGTSAPFIVACMKAEIKPSEHYDLSCLRSIGSTGAPLPPEGFDYVYKHIKEDVWLSSMSGGTDVCTAWVGGCPWLPVYEGEIQCRCLGTAMYAFDEEGHAVINEVGEMVVTKAMPCMPIYFWGDKDFERYSESYFEMYPGIWRHGDWLKITPRKSLMIMGRSDSTLNRQGIRIGTAEIYNVVDKIEAVKNSLILNLEKPNGSDYMPLFVVMNEGYRLSDEIKENICRQLKTEYSPRHVPDEIIEVTDIPTTISGKKMEAPVKKILLGRPLEKAINIGSMRNPESLEFFIAFAKKWKEHKTSG